MRLLRIATALAAALVLAGAASSSAGRLSVSSQRFRVIWPTLTFRAAFATECDVTLEGSFHTPTIAKVERTLIGYITRARAGVCAGGREMFLLTDTEELEGLPTFNTLPWHVKYKAFTGTLPTIRTFMVDIVFAGILIREAFSNCLYRSENEFPWRGWFELNAEHRVIGFRNDETAQIRKLQGAGCPQEGIMAGNAGVTVLNSTATITILLI
jgi:hypothetical protein